MSEEKELQGLEKITGSVEGIIYQNEENGYAIVKIADTGEGMSKEVRDHLFDPYFQGDSSHSRQGLGLGLSIVKRIVELCKGTITVRSKVGEGSIFTVILPM